MYIYIYISATYLLRNFKMHLRKGKVFEHKNGLQKVIDCV